MKTIKQSFEIIDEGNFLLNIEKRGRLCYKSEDKITEGSAVKFVKQVERKRHDSVLEMDSICVSIDMVVDRSKIDFYMKGSTFLDVFYAGYDNIVVAGNFRAIREFCIVNRSVVGAAVFKILREHFEELVPYDMSMDDFERELFAEYVVRSEDIEGVYSLVGKRLVKSAGRIAVRIVTNRAVTHEIVRHRPCSYLQESQRYVRYDGASETNQLTFIEPSAFNFSEEEMSIWKDSCSYAEKQYLKLIKTASPQAARTVLPNSTKTEIIVYATIKQWEHIFEMRCSPAAEPSMRELMIPLRKAIEEHLGNCGIGLISSRRLA